MTNNPMLNDFSQRNKPFSLFYKLFFALLFLMSMNFFNEFPTLILIAFILILLKKHLQFTIKLDIIYFIIFSVSLILFRSQHSASVVEIVKTLIYPICYIIGYNLISDFDSLKSQVHTFKTLVWILGLGAWFHFLFNFLINRNSSVGRNAIDIWTGLPLSATGQVALCTIILGVAIVQLICSNTFKGRIAPIIILGVTFLYNLILAGRSILLMAAIVLIVVLIYHIRIKPFSRSTLSLIFSILFVTVIISVMYGNNILNLRSIVEDSNLFKRFFDSSASSVDLSADSRFTVKLKYLKYLLVFPFGGSRIRATVGAHAHDLYLDTYDEAGIFAFLSITLIVIYFIRNNVRLLKSNHFTFETKAFILALFVTLNIEFLIEPILAGMPWLLACFCIIYGATSRLTDKTNKE